MKYEMVLSHANGYRELGMIKDAIALLKAELSSEDILKKETCEMKLALYMDANNWKEAEKTSRFLKELEPDQSSHWINWAYATRRKDDVSLANLILKEAEGLFPHNATIKYNLGCYACQKGELELAKGYVKIAIKLDPSVQKMVNYDDDLKEIQKFFS